MKSLFDIAVKEGAEPDMGSQPALETRQPLLYRKREYGKLPDGAGKTTSCQKTENPNDYGPDD